IHVQRVHEFCRTECLARPCLGDDGDERGAWGGLDGATNGGCRFVLPLERGEARLIRRLLMDGAGLRKNGSRKVLSLVAVQAVEIRAPAGGRAKVLAQRIPG